MYKYSDIRPKLFTEEGMEKVLKARDNVAKMIGLSGAATMNNLIKNLYGDSWLQLACIDYLVEKGEIREVKQVGDVMGQNRIFVK